jgi:hypothetical protein
LEPRSHKYIGEGCEDGGRVTDDQSVVPSVAFQCHPEGPAVSEHVDVGSSHDRIDHLRSVILRDPGVGVDVFDDGCSVLFDGELEQCLAFCIGWAPVGRRLRWRVLFGHGIALFTRQTPTALQPTPAEMHGYPLARRASILPDHPCREAIAHLWRPLIARGAVVELRGRVSAISGRWVCIQDCTIRTTAVRFDHLWIPLETVTCADMWSAVHLMDRDTKDVIGWNLCVYGALEEYEPGKCGFVPGSLLRLDPKKHKRRWLFTARKAPPLLDEW